jgi:transposase
VADEIQEVSGILAIMDRECGIEADRGSVAAQDARADSVKGAGPRQGCRCAGRVFAAGVRDDAPSAAAHLGGGTTRERQQENAARVGATDDQVGDPMRERAGFAGAGTRYDEKGRRDVAATRNHAMFARQALLTVEIGKVRSGHASRSRSGTD